jgi:DNA-binding transcriptional ArsR family regulator
MAPPSQTRILDRLGKGVASSAELEALLGLSQPAVSRQLRELIAAGRVLRLGSTRGARYALLRPIEGIGSQWELRRVDAGGAVHTVGRLYSLAADQYWFTPVSQPDFAWGEVVTDGLPYFLQDQRPGGFLGRLVPARYPELGLPARVIDWNDDHYLQYLTRHGSDTVGDLILGDESFNEYVELIKQRVPIAAEERVTAFPRLAREVMAGGMPGSSAHGEHPKFSALLRRGEGLQHVLVKFSPVMNTAVGQRWSDLLVAEHLAHEVLREAGVPAARSQIHHFGNQAFLELERFDRAGAQGRVGVTSLFAIDTTFYGKLDTWVASATRLFQERRIEEQTLERVKLVWTFGGLIANTDRHFGNLAMFDRYDGKFRLAPVYDMLPMLFAPLHDEILPRTFTPADPAAETLTVYPKARQLAEAYWRRVSRDSRVSQGFRNIAAGCAATLENLPRTGVYAYSPPAG